MSMATTLSVLEKQDNIQNQVGNLNRKLEKVQEIIKYARNKKKCSKKNNAFHGFSSRLDSPKGKISELEGQ